MTNKEEVLVVSAKITLAQFLKWTGLVENGAEAKNSCREGEVLLNGTICREPGKQLQQNDEITFDGAVYVPVWDKTNV